MGVEDRLYCDIIPQSAILPVFTDDRGQERY